ncbi:uncharacterized protein LOC134723262 [Mytilus trossulus]|uniref:uncharacterized protein LOC134723262 n=1 Tax=Mytilus trossulus TaxID=6551 RepID=UPI003006FB3E
MRLFGGYIIGAQLNQNGDQMNVGGCGMNKLRSQYTSCEVDLMYAVKQGMGYDCSCQIEHCLQHQADAGLCKSNDKCYIHVTDNKNSTANCKRGLNGKCNWNAC